MPVKKCCGKVGVSVVYKDGVTTYRCDKCLRLTGQTYSRKIEIVAELEPQYTIADILA